MPKPGETWALKTNPNKILRVDYVNSCGFVGFSGAAHIKRGYGTKKLSAFLRHYKPAQ